jgi:hypothetical protein
MGFGAPLTSMANLLNSTSRVVGQAKRFAQEILGDFADLLHDAGQYSNSVAQQAVRACLRTSKRTTTSAQKPRRPRERLRRWRLASARDAARGDRFA